MMDIEVANLREAYDGSFYTILGAGGDLAEWTDGIQKLFDRDGIGTVSRFVRTSGKEINHFAEERGHVAADNHFQDDLTVLMFPLDGLNGGKLAMFRLMAGDRWFDDLVNKMVAWEADDAAEDDEL